MRGHIIARTRSAREGVANIGESDRHEYPDMLALIVEAGPGQPGRREESSSVIHAHHLARGLVGSSNNEKLLAGR